MHRGEDRGSSTRGGIDRNVGDMSTAPEGWTEVFAALEKLRARWPVREWSYDHRLKCVASVIEAAQAADARAAAAEVLATEWNAGNLSQAPDGVRAVAERSGGLRGGQLLLWGGVAGQPGAFGLWWPWGDGSSTSLRIGLHDIDSPKERLPKMREIFGIGQGAAAAT